MQRRLIKKSSGQLIVLRNVKSFGNDGVGDIKSVGVANLNRLQLDSTKRTQVLSFNMQIFIVSCARIGGVDKI